MSALASAAKTEIAHNKPWVIAEDIAAVSASLSSGWLAPGREVTALESEFAHLHGGGEACAVSSGTAALLIALKSAGVGRGDKVAAPTYVCTAVLNAIAEAGAEPVLLDVKPDDFNIDPAALAALPAKPKATIAVHTYGAPADINALRRHAGFVIEDCCQSLGGMDDNGSMLGRDGDAAVASFYATKIVTSGHGGMVYAASGKAAAFARDFVNFDGRDDWKPRFNFQMTDFQAVLVHKQLARLGEIKRRRQAAAADYRTVLPAGYRVQSELDGTAAMPYRFVVIAPDQKIRDRLRAHFDQAGIRTIVPLERKELLHHLLGLRAERFPNAERAVDTTLSLPLYPALSEAEVARVADTLRKAPQP